MLSRKALLALSQTSTTFRDIAQPLAYRMFDAVPNNYVKFVRTLVERPDLASHVKEIHEDTYEIGGWSDEDDFDFLKTVAVGLGMEDEQDPEFNSAVEDDLSPGQFSMEILLALVPNLEVLELCINAQGNYEETTFKHLQRRRNRVGPAAKLHHLRRLQIQPDWQDHWGVWFSTPAVGVLLHMAPNLEHLAIVRNKGFDYEADADIPAIFPNPPLSLRTIQLRNCALSDEWSKPFVERLIGFAPRLEHFYYSAQVVYIGEMLGLHFSPQEFVNCLRSRRKTLKTIDVDLEEHMVDSWAELVTGDVLAEFENLEVLKLDDHAFCRHYVNPNTNNRHIIASRATCLTDLVTQSIKELGIKIHERSHVWPDLAELAASSAQYPNLERVVVRAVFRMRSTVTRDVFKEENQQHLKKLRQDFSKTSIRFYVLEELNG
jgi:hypothetical protein